MVILIACEKEVDLDLDQTESKLVVNALFNTDSLWKIELSKSKFVLDTSDLQVVTDAIVFIEDEEENRVLLSHRGDGIYQNSSQSPEVGKTYQLEVVHVELEDVTATSSLPANIDILDLKFGNEVLVNEETSTELLITFNDDPTTDDHYMVQINSDFWNYTYNKDWEIIDSSLIQYPIYFNSNNSSVSSSAGGGKGPEGQSALSFSDDLFNGETFTLDVLVNSFYINPLFGGTQLYVSISRISEEYYNYQTSYQRYLQSQGNPFAQPVQVYTNIEHGLGVFAGYSTSSQSIEF